MRTPNLTRKGLALALAGAFVLSAALGSALASVTVYDNNFSSRAEFKEMIKSGGGKRCDRKFRRKSEAMLASVKRSPTTCSFRAPVEGDKELPNHELAMVGKVLSKTRKSLRGGAFLELTARAGGGGIGYSLRVFPEKKRYELRRGPSGGGFPVTGNSNAINKVGQRNQLRLVATGSEVRAVVNGEEVAKLNDANPGQVAGRKVRFAVGSNKDKRGAVVATFKKLAVAVPDP